MDKSRTRDIKFRGKRVDNGEWEIGYLLKSASTLIAVDSEIVDGHWKLHEVDPATVGQYAWRKDKNGQEIYEGDILSRKEWGGGGSSHEDEERYEVEKLDYYLEEGEVFGHFRVSLWSGWCEVIGNIHDNPELLEEE